MCQVRIQEECCTNIFYQVCSFHDWSGGGGREVFFKNCCKTKTGPRDSLEPSEWVLPTLCSVFSASTCISACGHLCSQSKSFEHRTEFYRYLLAHSTPRVGKYGVLIARHWGVQLLQNDLHTTLTMDKATDVVHHGSFTEHAGALVGRPSNKKTNCEDSRFCFDSPHQSDALQKPLNPFDIMVPIFEKRSKLFILWWPLLVLPRMVHT